jgi:signal transduction histidine kinase
MFTAFAPAERAPLETILKQAQQFPTATLGFQLLDTIPNPFMLLNENRQIVYANRAIVEALSLADLNALLGQRPGEALDCVQASKNEAGCGTSVFCQTCGAVKTILAGLRGTAESNECRIMRHDGSALDLRVWGTPLEFEGRNFVAFTVQDISHEKRRQVLERLFFHDILNLMSVIVGYSELLLKEGVPARVREMLQVIQRVTDQMVEDIRMQHELNAAENGELRVTPQPMSSLDALRQIKVWHEGLEVAKDRAILIAPQAQDITFSTDKALLERVLGNMVKNALEACACGQNVTLSCGGNNSHIWFEVHNPVCMPDTVQLQVFQRSFSTKGKGRGVGTYSIKLLSERYLKGTVTFSSTPDQGTTFRVTYPTAL